LKDDKVYLHIYRFLLHSKSLFADIPRYMSCRGSFVDQYPCCPVTQRSHFFESR
jgi:hypothetical protein